MSIDSRLQGISTLITTQGAHESGQGSGFFYQKNAPRDPNKAEQWIEIIDTWLVTNRHVVLSENALPDTLSFYMRRVENGHLLWEPIVLDKAALLERLLIHEDETVDVCLIRVHDLLIKKTGDGRQYLAWHGVGSDNFAGQNKISPHCGSDIIVLGYPHGYYDDVNLFPVVKAGIIASKWGAPFKGKSCFLIDSKLFPGSSGSIVISKPTDVAVENGQIFHSSEKVFAFLGIFSSEPHLQHEPIDFEEFTLVRKSGFNVGIVWYANVVEEIRINGVQVVEV